MGKETVREWKTMSRDQFTQGTLEMEKDLVMAL